MKIKIKYILKDFHKLQRITIIIQLKNKAIKILQKKINKNFIKLEILKKKKKMNENSFNYS